MPCLGSMQRSAFYKWSPLQKKMLREIATPIHVYFSSTSLKPEKTELACNSKVNHVFVMHITKSN